MDHEGHGETDHVSLFLSFDRLGQGDCSFALLCFGVGTLADPTPRAQGASPSNMLSGGESVRGQRCEKAAKVRVPRWGQGFNV